MFLNDRDLLYATAVTQGWNRHRNKSQHRKLTLEKFCPPPLPGIEPTTFGPRVQDSTMELSLLPGECTPKCGLRINRTSSAENVLQKNKKITSRYCLWQPWVTSKWQGKRQQRKHTHAHTHACTHACMHTRTKTHTHTQTKTKKKDK